MFSTTSVEDNEVYHMPGAVSEYTVCHNPAAAHISMHMLQWDGCLLVERYSGKLLRTELGQY